MTIKIPPLWNFSFDVTPSVPADFRFQPQSKFKKKFENIDQILYLFLNFNPEAVDKFH